MTVSRFFEWFLFAAFACWGALGVTQALWLRARGVRIIAVDRQRSGREMLADLLAIICLQILGCEVVAHVWSVGLSVGPASLDRILTDGIVIKVLGAVLVLSALVLYAVSLTQLGASWRLGIDRDTPGPLVTDGVYRWTRHPIYVASICYSQGPFWWTVESYSCSSPLSGFRCYIASCGGKSVFSLNSTMGHTLITVVESAAISIGRDRDGKRDAFW